MNTQASFSSPGVQAAEPTGFDADDGAAALLLRPSLLRALNEPRPVQERTLRDIATTLFHQSGGDLQATELLAAGLADVASVPCLVPAVRELLFLQRRKSVQAEFLRFIQSVTDITVERLVGAAAAPLSQGKGKASSWASLLEILGSVPFHHAALLPHIAKLCEWLAAQVALDGPLRWDEEEDSIIEDRRLCTSHLLRALAKAIPCMCPEGALEVLESGRLLQCALRDIVSRPLAFGALLDQRRLWFSWHVIQCLCMVARYITKEVDGLRMLMVKSVAHLSEAAGNCSSLDVFRQSDVCNKAWILCSVLAFLNSGNGFEAVHKADRCCESHDALFESSLRSAVPIICGLSADGPLSLRVALIPCVASLLRNHGWLIHSNTKIYEALGAGLHSDSKAMRARTLEALMWLLETEVDLSRTGQAVLPSNKSFGPVIGDATVGDAENAIRRQPLLLSGEQPLPSEVMMRLAALQPEILHVLRCAEVPRIAASALSIFRALGDLGVLHSPSVICGVVAACLVGFPANVLLARCLLLELMMREPLVFAEHLCEGLLEAQRLMGQRRWCVRGARGVQLAAMSETLQIGDLLPGIYAVQEAMGNIVASDHEVARQVLLVDVRRVLEGLASGRHRGKQCAFAEVAAGLLSALPSGSSTLNAAVALHNDSDCDSFSSDGDCVDERLNDNGAIDGKETPNCRKLHQHEKTAEKEVKEEDEKEEEEQKQGWMAFCDDLAMKGTPAAAANVGMEEVSSVSALPVVPLGTGVMPVESAPVGEAVDVPPVWKRFTPETLRPNGCLARTWRAGLGGQCIHNQLASDEFCRLHSGEKWKAHGRVDGAVPDAKLKLYIREERKRQLKDEGKNDGGQKKAAPTTGDVDAETTGIDAPPVGPKLKRLRTIDAVPAACIATAVAAAVVDRNAVGASKKCEEVRSGGASAGAAIRAYAGGA